MPRKSRRRVSAPVRGFEKGNVFQLKLRKNQKNERIDSSPEPVKRKRRTSRMLSKTAAPVRTKKRRRSSEDGQVFVSPDLFEDDSKKRRRTDDFGSTSSRFQGKRSSVDIDLTTENKRTERTKRSRKSTPRPQRTRRASLTPAEQQELRKFAKAVKDLMNDRKETQTSLARKLGESQAALSKALGSPKYLIRIKDKLENWMNTPVPQEDSDESQDFFSESILQTINERNIPERRIEEDNFLEDTIFEEDHEDEEKNTNDNTSLSPSNDDVYRSPSLDRDPELMRTVDIKRRLMKLGLTLKSGLTRSEMIEKYRVQQELRKAALNGSTKKFLKMEHVEENDKHNNSPVQYMNNYVDNAETKFPLPSPISHTPRASRYTPVDNRFQPSSRNSRSFFSFQWLQENKNAQTVLSMLAIVIMIIVCAFLFLRGMESTMSTRYCGDTVVKDCIKCPEHARCQHGKFKCTSPYIKSWGRCVKNHSVERREKEFKKEALKLIEKAAAAKECSDIGDGYITEKELLKKIQERKGGYPEYARRLLMQLANSDVGVSHRKYKDRMSFTSTYGSRQYDIMCRSRKAVDALFMYLVSSMYSNPLGTLGCLLAAVVALYIMKIFNDSRKENNLVNRIKERLIEHNERVMSEIQHGNGNPLPPAMPIEHLRTELWDGKDSSTFFRAVTTLRDRYPLVRQYEQRINGIQYPCLSWYDPITSPSRSRM